VEFGAGGGALTRILLQCRARVAAIEVDPHRCRDLKRRWPTLWVVCHDLLRYDLARIPRETGEKPKLAANLPYHISGPSLIHIASHAGSWSRAVVTVQKEVAKRLVASPGTRAYGRLTVMMRSRAEPRMLFTIAPGSFRPRPKVHSAVVELRPHPQPLIPDGLSARFREVVRGAFVSRRKMLKNTPIGQMLAGSGMDDLLRRRPEELDVADFVMLARLSQTLTASRRN
jgi:16S rRNA (adenine1518-N6/adenine1519-N6)-dimethyltransferase